MYKTLQRDMPFSFLSKVHNIILKVYVQFACVIVSEIIELQLYSEKCTELYFKVRDDDLSSKKG